MKFGRWTVEGDQPGKRPAFMCRCECGTVRMVLSSSLSSGKSLSCGCLHREMTSARMRTHGHAGRGQASRTYETWLNMNRRCNEPTNDDFAKYGGRGIKVCEQWATFEGFLADMGERPGRRTLDRIENDGNYEPGNCRWATARQQNQNRSSTRLCPLSAVLVRELGRRGHSARELGRAFGVNSGTIHCVLVGRSWTDAIATLSQRSFL